MCYLPKLVLTQRTADSGPLREGFLYLRTHHQRRYHGEGRFRVDECRALFSPDPLTVRRGDAAAPIGTTVATSA